MTTPSFKQAQFRINLNLADSSSGLLCNARQAIRREFRDSVKWKRLQCRSVRAISESVNGILFELQIGHAVEFDWTWEGAIAFRPLVLKEFEATQETFFDDGADDPEIKDSTVWLGEVMEVDEATGRIFIVVVNPEYPPRCGSFYIRPFEFLSSLDAVYNSPAFSIIQKYLPNRLAAAVGNIHPGVINYQAVGLSPLQHLWRKSWSMLWGPPGTGKTYTTGQQVAHALADDSERILVISTTNRATDAAAVAIGNAAKNAAREHLSAGQLLRIGKGASLQRFESAGLTDMLRGTEIEFLAQIDVLTTELIQADTPEIKALLRDKIKKLQTDMRDASRRNFLDSTVKVVVSTAFRASMFLSQQEVKDNLEKGFAPFTTIFIDEAGLMSRVAISALSLLASRRVVLVGDSKQLAPISRISRIMPPSQGDWLASSGVSHLQNILSAGDGVHVLQEQRRMHTDICAVVSAFQYDGFLTTASDVVHRSYELPFILKEQPRAIWFVLDEESDDLPSIRAERGPGNRSWVRPVTLSILEKLFSDSTFASATGLFISPFKAQAKKVAEFLANHKWDSWTASTVHSQQGSEADIVLFDSVNAGSYGWPYDEWKRLVNVALSRAREVIIVLSSRAEMEEPYLRPLLSLLQPRVLSKRGAQFVWQEVPVKAEFSSPSSKLGAASYSLGSQLSERKALRPVLSREQERLCGLALDGKPRLVRGVAGSGKTVVLAHWLIQTVKQFANEPSVRIWVVFANRSLQSLIGDSVELAWSAQSDGKSFPWDRVELHHINKILAVLLPEVGLSLVDFGYGYDQAAEAYLIQKSNEDIDPRCDALFIDEAQDMGPNTLKLLAAIVRKQAQDDDNSRAVNIFYDNAQNIYGRNAPKWSDFGLDMRGRSTVMTESYRSTKPITEFALNVLYCLQAPEANPDHKDLLARGLIEHTRRSGSDWWTVRFNQIDGPKPEFRQYMSLDQEFEAIGNYCCELIGKQDVQPADICILYIGDNIKYRLEKKIAPLLAPLGVQLSVQTNRSFQRSGNVLLATTAHSFKGYDSEIVIIPAVDQYIAKDKGILASALYVAMTRARSILTIFAQQKGTQDAQLLYTVIEDCLNNLTECPAIESDISPQDDLVDILDIIGHQHGKWLIGLWNRYGIYQEPISAADGEIIAEPLFWFSKKDQLRYACFGVKRPRQRVLQRLKDLQIELLEPGDPVGAN